MYAKNVHKLQIIISLLDNGNTVAIKTISKEAMMISIMNETSKLPR
jgi:hypothetical protein